jgi:peptidoglycan hydrolase-like protein with peptidoglycan-binding domain
MTNKIPERISDADVWRAADELDCGVAAVRAVLEVESRGGFLPDGRPKILFERHYFSRLTGGRFDRTHPNLSNRGAGGYIGGAAEHDRLEAAARLDRSAALKSASWGLFQIMGANFALCGFADVEAYVRAMRRSEGDQLAAFVQFVRASKLDGALRDCNWAAFARAYNGPAYKKNRYDEKLAAAYARHDGVRPGLKKGDGGAAVRKLQAALGVTVDGRFGPATERALVAFQSVNGLPADGVARPATWVKLEEATRSPLAA